MKIFCVVPAQLRYILLFRIQDLSRKSKLFWEESFTISRILPDRHKMAINLSFTDGHAERVQLADPWKLRWNKKFEHVDVLVSAK
jgi:hypothetical protein